MDLLNLEEEQLASGEKHNPRLRFVRHSNEQTYVHRAATDVNRWGRPTEQQPGGDQSGEAPVPHAK